MLQDQADTSDEESSDSENDDFHLLIDPNKKASGKKINPPVSPTKGEGDCAFHATLGQWNEITQQFEVDDIKRKREGVAKAVRDCKQDSPLFPLIKAAIMALVMGGIQIEGESFKKLKDAYRNYEEKDKSAIKIKRDAFEGELNKYSLILDHIKKFIEEYINNKQIGEPNSSLLRTNLYQQFCTCENEGDVTLRALIMSFPELEEAYQEYKKPNQVLDIDRCFTEPALLNEYANFLSNPGQWLLPCELNIIAYVFNIGIDYYATCTAAPDYFNPNNEAPRVAVCFNGYNHYERMGNLKHENKHVYQTKIKEQQETFASNNNKRERVFLARGIHFYPSFFNSKQRRIAQRKEYHLQIEYSQATTMLAEDGRVPKDKNGNFNYKHADRLVKAYFELLKLTPDKDEHNVNDKKINRVGNFTSLYEHFIQAYVNTYEGLFVGGGIHRNFNFYSNYNPMISTIPRIENIVKYALGQVINQKSRYLPKLRKSTGEFKHRRLGYAHIYAIDKDYYDKHAVSIGELADKNIIAPGARREKDEVLFESSIPRKFILGYQLFSLPSFNEEWSAQMQQNYGLNEQVYDQYKVQLLENSVAPNDVIIQLISPVTNHQSNQLVRKVETIRTQLTQPQKITQLSPLLANLKL